jgi:hypothetical protein
MSTYLSLGGDGPGAMMDAGLRLQSAGTDFKETAERLVRTITDLEAKQPWGRDDDYAKAFLENYHGKGPVPFNKMLQAALSDSSSVLTQIGGNTVHAMAKYQAVDGDGANQIGSTTEA